MSTKLLEHGSRLRGAPRVRSLAFGGQMVRIAVIVVAISLGLFYSATGASAGGTANEMMPGCREFLTDGSNFYLQGFCAGILAGLSYTDSHGCVPNAVTTGQVVRVVVKYIDSHPERMHEDFGALALEALRSAFPCR